MGKRKKPQPPDDPAMAAIRARWQQLQAEGWTQQQLGERMGYPAESARKSVSQFLKTHDARTSVLRRFAHALGIPLSEFLAGCEGDKVKP